ncbi:MAG TPA: DUF448 domain-containing protein [Myxococcota bacterium]|nr:DUF448 domain-containing protein [Myxococcota bacterium]
MAQPERMCIVTRERRSQADLVRLVLDPEGVLRVDYRARLGGRGAWVLPQRGLIEKIETRPGLLHRSLRAQDVDARGLLERVRAANSLAVRDALSLCARAGALAGGKDGVRAVIGSGGGLAVVLASDSSPRLAEDLRRRATGLLVIEVPLDREALGAQVGKGPRAALAVRRSKPGRSLARELHRMAALS